MNVGFFVQGDEHLPITKYLLESCKKSCPEAPVFQLTDEKTAAVAEPIRIPGDMPMGVRRVSHYAALEGDWLFVDTDILIKRDVSHVFDEPFDLAVASREGTYMHGSSYSESNPYNFGVVFSRNREPWKLLLKHLREMDTQYQNWGGEQLLLGALVKSCRYKTKVLSSSYNFTPLTRDEDLSDKHIIHLKGPRKQWISTICR